MGSSAGGDRRHRYATFPIARTRSPARSHWRLAPSRPRPSLVGDNAIAGGNASAVLICSTARCWRGGSWTWPGDRLAVGGLLAVGGRVCEEVVEAAGEVALEAAQRALGGVAFGFFASEVLLGRRVALGAGDRDDVQRVVELAVPAAVEPVLGALPPRSMGSGRSPSAARSLSACGTV